MRGNWSRLVPTLLAVMTAGSLGVLAPPARADITTTPTAWSNFGTAQAVTFGGVPGRDFEGGTSNDPTNGGASFTAEVDIASGGPAYSAANCNPAIAPYTQCGNQTSTFWSYYNGGTSGSSTTSDDYLFFRMRVNGDPRGSDSDCFSNSHWNFLIDNDNDGFKEWWIDAWGNQSRVRVLYEDNGSQIVSNDNPVPPATDTWINSLAMCATTSGTCGSGPTTVTCSNSHSRVCGVSSGSNLSTCNSTTDATGEWYVDVQVPVRFLTNSSGSMSTDPITLGTALVTTYPPQLGFFFSTSDSSTDPVQKDYISTCVSIPSGPCAFGDTTAVTLSYFHAERKGNAVVFDWSTATETGNAGFDVFVKTARGWQQVNRESVASQKVFSTGRSDYRLRLAGVEGEQFKVRDRDLLGKAHWHGPFELGTVYGNRRAPARPDWKAIGAEHRAKEQARASAARIAAKASLATSATVGLEVSEDGLYRLTAAALLAAGFDWSGVPAKEVALTHVGKPVPVRVVAAADGTFGAGAYLEFWGEAVRSLYTHTNLYQLTRSNSLSRRIGTRPAGPQSKDSATSFAETVTVDDNRAWSFGSPTSDPWYREVIVGFTSPVTRTYTIPVDRLVSDAGARLSVELWGMTDWPQGDDHHVRVALNGVTVADRLGGGIQALSIDAAIPAGVLQEGNNTLTVTVVGDTGVDYDVIGVDRFAISYGRGFEVRSDRLTFAAPADGSMVRVSGLTSPDVLVYNVAAGGTVMQLRDVEVSGSAGAYVARFDKAFRSGRYAVSTAGAMRVPGIRALAPPADVDAGAAQYLVISHPDFVAGLAPLLAARSAGGLAVKLVTTDDVYGRYSGGVFDPLAIKSYITKAVATQGTESVLLVGADTYDYLNYTGTGSISFVPTLYAPTGPIVRYTPADSLYGDVDDDGVPDVAVGRLPVRNAAELSAVVAKTLAYGNGNAGRRAVLAADGADASGNFAQMSDDAATALPASWSLDRAYVDQGGTAAARTTLASALAAGARLTHYVGHSDTSFWSFSGMWTNGDVSALTNGANPTVVAQWGCWNTFYASPDASSMSDKWMTSAGGAAAVVGPAGLTDVASDRQISSLFLAEATRAGQPIGKALIAAKRQLAAARPWMVDVIVGVNLMGDPALVVEP